MDKIQLSIVVAVYNETSTNLQVLIERLEAVLIGSIAFYEVVFVNDGSNEDTSNCLAELSQSLDNVKLVNLSRNFGQQAAISAGINFASGEAIITMDSDLQDPPEVIPEMVRIWQSGFNVVYAKRSSRNDRILKRLTAFLFYRTMSLLSSIAIPQDTGEFRLIDRQVAEVLKRLPERTRYIRGLIPWLGFRQTAILVDRNARQHGKSVYTLRRLVALAFDGILSFSFMPLYAISIIGMVVIFSSCLIPFFWLAVLRHHASLSIWLVTVSLFLIGSQFLFTGILGSYIAKILDEVRARPAYVVSKLSGQPFVMEDAKANSEQKLSDI